MINELILLKKENSNFVLDENIINKINELKGNNYKIISIIGPYRTGKSLFLNYISNIKFTIGHTTNSCTKGINYGIDEENKVIYLDVEGCFSSDKESNNEYLLYSMLISNILIYNFIGAIDTINLDNLQLLYTMSKKFNLRRNDINLVILLRDFNLILDKHQTIMDYFYEKSQKYSFDNLFKNIKIFALSYPFNNNVIKPKFLAEIKEISDYLKNMDYFTNIDVFTNYSRKIIDNLNNNDYNFNPTYDIEEIIFNKKYEEFKKIIILDNTKEFNILSIFDKTFTLFEIKKKDEIIKLLKAWYLDFQKNKSIEEFNTKNNNTLKLKEILGLPILNYNKEIFEKIKNSINITFKDNEDIIILFKWLENVLNNLLNKQDNEYENLTFNNRLLNNKIKNINYLIDEQKKYINKYNK